MSEKVILVNPQDEVIGEMEKLQAHRLGLLHRAFSVFIFNKSNHLLLQQRAFTKYHSPGLWTNTCCSHPRPGEETLQAAHRRLKEEMGLDTPLTYTNFIIYKTVMDDAGFEQGLTEHEYDYIYTGVSDKEPLINKEEVESYQWLSLAEIKEDLRVNPDKYTIWFKIIIEKNF